MCVRVWAVFGLFGAHRFYVGRYESGLVYIFTLGGFFVGWAYDFFILPQLVEEVGEVAPPPPLFSGTLTRALSAPLLDFRETKF